MAKGLLYIANPVAKSTHARPNNEDEYDIQFVHRFHCSSLPRDNHLLKNLNLWQFC